MTSAERPFVVFDVIDVAGADTADALIDRTREQLDHTAGLLSARGHLSLDGATVVWHERWVNEAAYRAVSYGATVRSAFRGFELGGISGPDAGVRPGVVAVAMRHVSGPEAASALSALLRSSGEWKRQLRGFIGATAFLSTDGRTYLNYPQWINDVAYESYMADARIAATQEDIARFEVADPEFVLCRVMSDIEPRRRKGVVG